MTGEARRGYDAALRGDLGAAIDARASLGDRPVDRAWRAALDALRAFATGDDARALGVAALDAAIDGSRDGAASMDGDTRAVLSLVCGHVARARALAFDRLGVEAACAAIERVTEGSTSVEALGHRDVVRAWRDVLSGARVSGDLEETVKHATQVGRAELALEAMALRALDAANLDELDSALVLARRASRMGRTESIPLFEHLVNLVLARVRRITGRPHLATRILAALLDVSSPPFRPWLVLELALARGQSAPLNPSIEGARATHAVEALLAAAWRGDVAAFDGAVADAQAALGSLAPFARDLAHARAAIDPRAPVPDELAAFAQGATSDVPLGLDGLAGPALARSSHVAWVLSPLTGAPRRVLAPGVALSRALTEANLLDESGVQLRTDSAVAMLALAGTDGVEENQFFRSLYGFDYEADRHQSVRGVLYGRMRKRLEPLAALVREAGRLSLGHDAPLLAPDPRCTPPAELGILRMLAERRRAAPKEVAAALGIPLRTAQDFLRRLTDDGAVRAERASRGLHYVLEDTTFSEPTRALKGG